MLSRKEKIVMSYILNSSNGKTTCLLSPLDVIHALEPKYSANEIEIQALLDGLSQENYISLVNSDKNGELIYCITILPKGRAFTREEKNIKKTWTNALIRTVILAVVSFVVGLILKALFT